MTVIASRRRIAVISAGRWTRRAGKTLVGLLKHLIAFHNLLDLLETLRAQRRRHQGHHGGALSGIHFLEADPAPGNKGGWKV